MKVKKSLEDFVDDAMNESKEEGQFAIQHNNGNWDADAIVELDEKCNLPEDDASKYDKLTQELTEGTCIDFKFDWNPSTQLKSIATGIKNLLSKSSPLPNLVKFIVSEDPSHKDATVIAVATSADRFPEDSLNAIKKYLIDLGYEPDTLRRVDSHQNVLEIGGLKAVGRVAEKLTMKESVSEDAVWSAIFDKFKGYMTDDFEDVVKDVIDRVSDYSDTSDIDSAIDDALIYDGPKWEIMQHYQDPENADYSSALESFIEDILAICSALALEDEEEDEEEIEESLKESQCIVGVKDSGERCYYTVNDTWEDNPDKALVFDNAMEARDKWFRLTNGGKAVKGFKRIFVPNFEGKKLNEKMGAVIFSPKKNAYVGLVTLYTNDGPVTKEVEFKEIGNGLYPVDEKHVFERGLGPMYDGHDIDGKRIYDRYETQEVYDALSENKKCNEDVNPLADLQKEPVIELDDGTVLGIEYDNGRLFAGSITNSGIIKEYYVDYDAELSLDANLEKLMEVIGNDAQLSSGWMEVASKEVRDSNGDMTDYTWYTDKHGLNIFMFGDKDVTDPDANYADWETESDTEAQDWFDNYTGFEDDEDEDDLEFTDDDMNAGQWYESFDRFVKHKLNSIPKMTNEALIKEYRMFRRSNHEEDRPIKEALRRELKNRKMRNIY